MIFIIFIIITNLKIINCQVKTKLPIEQLEMAVPLAELDAKSSAYDEFGNLYFGGNKDTWESVKLYMNPNSYCRKDENEKGLSMDLVFCIPAEFKRPTKHRKNYCITFCYKPQLTVDKLKEDYKGYALKKVLNEVACADRDDHGFKIILIHNDDTDSIYYVRIIANFDSNQYDFPVSKLNKTGILNLCFKIKLGSNNSVETKITDLDDNSLVLTKDNETSSSPVAKYTPNLKKPKNFWLFTMDFLPMRNHYYANKQAVYYAANFQYKSEYKDMLAYFKSEGDCYGGCLLGCQFEYEKTTEIIQPYDSITYVPPETYEYESTIDQYGNQSEKEMKQSFNAKYFTNEFIHIAHPYNFCIKIHVNESTGIIEVEHDGNNELKGFADCVCPVFKIHLECIGWKIREIKKKEFCYPVRRGRNGQLN